jgi:hypothetical protein
MQPKVTSLSFEDDSFLFDDGSKPKVWKLGQFKHQQFFSFNLSIPSVMPQEFERSIGYILANSKLTLRGSYVDKYKRHYLLLLLNLARSLLCKEWLLIPMNSDAYKPDSDPHRKGFNLRYMKDIIDTLYDSELIHVKKGKKYNKQPQLTSIQPTELYGPELCLIALESEKEFTGENVILSKPIPGYSPSHSSDLQFAQDQADMTTINTFLQPHSWPMKGPMKRIYSGEIGLSGRIYCDFQTIPKRSVRIRPTSLIDEEPIAEVDIKSSHPRLAAQIFESIRLPRDFYNQVSLATDVFASKVKGYFRVALSSDNRESALGAFVKMDQINTTLDFNLVEGWMGDNLPNIPLYQSWSKVAMNLEGEMIKHVMLQGVKDNKVVLPIHDAVAVKVQDAQWAKDSMHRAWLEVMNEDYCEVDIEYPDNFSTSELLGP